MKKRILILILAVAFLLAGCSAKTDTITNVSEVKLAANQTLITGEVTAIAGNTVALTVGTLETKQQNSAVGPMASGAGTKSGSSATAGNNSNTGSFSGSSNSADSKSGSLSNTLAGSSSDNSYVSGVSYAGSRLSSTTNVTVTDTDGNSVKNAGTGGFGGMESANSRGAMTGGSSGTTTGTANVGTGFSSSKIKLSDETMDLTIPVGTKVLMTSNGTLTNTTFGRIQESDIVQIIVQTDSGGNKTVIEAQIMG